MGGGRGGMTVIHIILMAPYIQTNNEELYLYNNDVTYYVITRNRPFPRSMRSQGKRPGCGLHVKRVDHGDAVDELRFV